jgi:hypothetical protein
LGLWLKPKDQQMKRGAEAHPYKPEAAAREKLFLADASGLYRAFSHNHKKRNFKTSDTGLYQNKKYNSCLVPYGFA